MRPGRRLAERGHGLRFATGTGSLATSVGLLRLPAVDRCAAESRLLSATCCLWLISGRSDGSRSLAADHCGQRAATCNLVQRSCLFKRALPCTLDFGGLAPEGNVVAAACWRPFQCNRLQHLRQPQLDANAVCVKEAFAIAAACWKLLSNQVPARGLVECNFGAGGSASVGGL